LIQSTRTIPAGTFTVNSSGVVTFVPSTNFNGIASITYTVQDDAGTTSNAATATVTVNSVNSDPIANNDATTTNEDAAVSVNVTTNDTDADGTINAATVDLNPTSAGIQSSHTIAEGTFTVNNAGLVTFTPISNFNGNASISYTVNDNVGTTSNAASITITVTSVNDLPVANADAAATTEATAVTLNVTTNDTDVDGTIDVTTVDLNTTTAGIQNTNTTAAGTFAVNTSGVLTFTPTGTFSGSASLSYRVNDNSGGTSNAATITIAVTAVNDPPIANDDATSTNEDTSVTLNLVANDTDEDGTINVATVDLNTTIAGIQSTITTAAGTYTVNTSGIVSFAPAANFNGIAIANYTVNDNGGLTSSPATITITITAANDAPVASNDILATDEDEIATLNIISNDTDPDGTIDATTIDLNTTTVAVESTHTTPAGAFSVNSSGLLTFTPKANFAGNATLTYRVKDNNGSLSNVATINITVNGVNDPPTFDDFEDISPVKIYKNSGQKVVSVTGISPGPLETENMLITAISSNTEVIPNPAVTYGGTGATASIAFTPVGGKSGTVTITVKIVDTALNEFTRTFTVVVIDVKISSQPGTVATLLNPYSYQVVVQVTPESERAFVDPQITVVTKPAWLTFSIATQTLSGTPPANAAMSNPIKIQVKPKNVSTVLDEQNYILTINVSPVVTTFEVTALEDIARPFTQSEFNNAFADGNNDVLTKIKILTLPQQGKLRLGTAEVSAGQEIPYNAIPNLSYLSTLDFSGTDAFTWEGYDAFSVSNTAAINVTIEATNDPPRITVIESTILSYDQGLSLPILVTETFNAVDIDDTHLVNAQIKFGDSYSIGNDQLIFFDTDKIIGSFESQSGILTLTGIATVQEYVDAIRTIRYNFVNYDGILKESRSIHFRLSDDESIGEEAVRELVLDYSFEGLDIPNAFTPDGNNKNDTWNITSGTSGVSRFNDAEIKIYNQRGMLVYEAKGFDTPWDGMMGGQVLPAATYYYTIDLKFDNKVFKGIVTILR
jgi:gliding motility-associated-like protein